MCVHIYSTSILIIRSRGIACAARVGMRDMLFCPCWSEHLATFVLRTRLCWEWALSLAEGWTWGQRRPPRSCNPQIQVPLGRCDLTLPQERQNRGKAPGQASSPAAYKGWTALINRSFLPLRSSSWQQLEGKTC